MMEVGQQMPNNERQANANPNTLLFGPCRVVLVYRPTRSDLFLLEVTE